MDVEIRKATISDLEAIQNLNRQLFEKEYVDYDSSLKVSWPFDREGIKYFTDIINDGITYVAVVNAKIIGYLAGRADIRKSYTTELLAEIDNMFVLEEYRNQGVGSKLITKFKDYCAQNHVKELRVTAYTNNKEAINFYMKNGFGEFETTLTQRME